MLKKSMISSVLACRASDTDHQRESVGVKPEAQVRCGGQDGLTCISFPSALPALPPTKSPSSTMGSPVASCFTSVTLMSARSTERSDSWPGWPSTTCRAAISSQSPATRGAGTVMASAAVPGRTWCTSSSPDQLSVQTVGICSRCNPAVLQREHLHYQTAAGRGEELRTCLQSRVGPKGCSSSTNRSLHVEVGFRRSCCVTLLLRRPVSHSHFVTERREVKCLRCQLVLWGHVLCTNPPKPLASHDLNFKGWATGCRRRATSHAGR